MTRIYLSLSCSKCGAKLWGLALTTLITTAQKLGWTGPLEHGSVFDLCPECSKKKQDETSSQEETLVTATLFGLSGLMSHNNEQVFVSSVVNDPASFQPSGGTFGGGGATESWDSSSDSSSSSDSGSSSSSD